MTNAPMPRRLWKNRVVVSYYILRLVVGSPLTERLFLIIQKKVQTKAELYK